MKIDKDCAVTIEYEVTTKKGDVLESSKLRGSPLEFIFGKASLLPGFDKNLSGMAEGEEKSFEIPPEAFFQDGVMPRAEFPKETKIEKGARFEANLPGGGGSVQIVIVDPDAEPMKVRFVPAIAAQAPLKVKCKVLTVRAAKV